MPRFFLYQLEFRVGVLLLQLFSKIVIANYTIHLSHVEKILFRNGVSLFMIPKMGMEGFFLARVLSWVIEAVYSALLFFFGKWNPDKRALKAKTE